MRVGTAMLVGLLSGCGGISWSGDWEDPGVCSVIPSCEGGLWLALEHAAPLRRHAYVVELITDAATSVWSCAPEEGCTTEGLRFDTGELAVVEATATGFTARVFTTMPPLVTGPDEVRVRITQGTATLLDVELAPDYELVETTRCHECEQATVALTLE